MTFDEFDEATPRMVQLFINGYSERAEERQRQLTIAAFHGVGFNCIAQTPASDGGGADKLEQALHRALFGDEPGAKAYDAEFERRASGMSTFFGRIKGKGAHEQEHS